MEHVLTSVLPIFSLVVLGYLAGRLAWVNDATHKGLTEFTFKLAIPALLFRTMALAELPDIPPYMIWAAYFSTVLLAWALVTLSVIFLLRRPVVDSAPISMSASFGNVVMVGIPLCLGGIGPETAGPIAVIISLHSPVLWTLASIHLSLSNSDTGRRSFGDIVRGLADELSRNVVIMAILAGTLWRLTGFGVHPIALSSLDFLGQAAIPSALVSLGLSLVALKIKGQAPTLALILLVKLTVMPLIAYVVAVEVLALPLETAAVIIVFAAMPTGVNAYLFAAQNGRAMNSASGAVALGTMLSVVTASILMAFIGGLVGNAVR